MIRRAYAPRFERPVHRDRAHGLERPGDLEDAKVVAAVADDLDADRQAACVETHVDRAGWLPGLVEGRRKNGVPERHGAVGARLLRGEVHHRERGRDQIVEGFERCEKLRLHPRDLGERAIEVGRRIGSRLLRPVADIGVQIVGAMRRQVVDLNQPAHLEEKIHRRIAVPIKRRDEGFDDRAGASEQPSGRLHGVAHDCFRFRAEADVRQDADPQALEVAVEPLVIEGPVVGEGPGVALVGAAENGEQPGDVFDTPSHRPGHAHEIGREVRHAAMGRFQGSQAAMR